MLILNGIPVACLKKGWDGTTKDWKSCLVLKRHLMEHLTNNQANWQQVSDMTIKKDSKHFTQGEPKPGHGPVD